MRGSRLAVISDGGGHATVVSDCAGRHGLELAALTPETKGRLRDILPRRAATDNPIDFAGYAESDPNSTAKVLATCLEDPGVDGLIFAGHFGGYHLMTTHEETQRRISAIERQAAIDMAATISAHGKPVILHTDHGERHLPTLAPLCQAGIPIFANLESSAKGMAALHRWAHRPAALDFPEDDPVNSEVTSVREGTRMRAWLESDGRRLLTESGLSMPTFAACHSVAEVLDAAATMRKPIALKLLSTKLIHKSDAGGVLLNLKSQVDVTRGCETLARLAAQIGESNPIYLITPMIAPGIETIIGAKRDQQFGPIVLFGSGGVLVEAVHDVKILLAPCTEHSARVAIASTVAGKLLSGHRGHKAFDTEGLVRLLVQVSKLIAQRRDITEIDLNPVITNEAGSHIADVRIITV